MPDDKEGFYLSKVEIVTIKKRLIELRQKLSDDEAAFCEAYLRKLTVATMDKIEESNIVYEGMVYVGNEDIHEYLHLSRRLLRDLLVTKDDLLLKLQQQIDRNTRPVAVIGEDGQPTGEYISNTKEAGKLMELMCKYHFNEPSKDIKENKNANFVDEEEFKTFLIGYDQKHEEL